MKCSLRSRHSSRVGSYDTLSSSTDFAALGSIALLVAAPASLPSFPQPAAVATASTMVIVRRPTSVITDMPSPKAAYVPRRRAKEIQLSTKATVKEDLRNVVGLVIYRGNGP